MKTTSTCIILLLTATSFFLLTFMVDVSHGFMIASPFHVSPMTRSKNPAGSDGGGPGGQCSLKPYRGGDIPTPVSPLYQRPSTPSPTPTFGGDSNSDGGRDRNPKIVSGSTSSRPDGGGVNQVRTSVASFARNASFGSMLESFSETNIFEPPIFIFTAQDFESDRIFVNAGGNGQLLKNESFKIADGGGLILSVDLFDLLPIDKETEEFLGSSDDQPISNLVQLETPGIYIIVDDSSESEIFIRAGGTGRFLKSEESRLDLSKNDNIRLSVDLFEVLPVDKEKEFGSSETPPLSNAGIGEDKKKESVVNINLDPNISESEVTVNVSVPNVTINIASRKGPKEINPAKDDEVSDTSP